MSEPRGICSSDLTLCNFLVTLVVPLLFYIIQMITTTNNDINLLTMTNTYDQERHRLKLYGEMLKSDIIKQKQTEKHKRDEELKQDSVELEKHLMNTKRFNDVKKGEIRDINKSLQNDNKMLTTMKRTFQLPHTYAEEGNSFTQNIASMDGQRLDKLKNDLDRQAHEHQYQLSNRKVIDDKIRQIQRLEDQNHQNRQKQMQRDSVRNYQNIKQKHQQDMKLFDKHRRLVQENTHYRDQLQNFTQVNHGILDRYNRNEYHQRKANLLQNQETVKQQMAELQRRKSQEVIEYKKSIGDLQHSMLRSVLVKPQNYQPKAYSNQLKNQMFEETQRKQHDKLEKKQKIQMNNIFGGIHGQDRNKMLKQIDRSLGISKAEASTSQINASNYTQAGSYQSFDNRRKDLFDNTNPELTQAKPTNFDLNHNPTSRRSAIGAQKNSQTPQSPRQEPQPINYSIATTEGNDRQSVRSNSNPTQFGNKCYKSFDVITGKQKYYGYD